MKESDVQTEVIAKEPTPRQEIRFMERASRAVSHMGAAGRQWLLRWMRDNYPADWRLVEWERRPYR